MNIDDIYDVMKHVRNYIDDVYVGETIVDYGCSDDDQVIPCVFIRFTNSSTVLKLKACITEEEMKEVIATHIIEELKQTKCFIVFFVKIGCVKNRRCNIVDIFLNNVYIECIK